MVERSLPHALAAFLLGFWEAFADAESKGDFSIVAPQCAEGLVFQSPGAEPEVGLSTIIEGWWNPPETYRITFNSAEVAASNDLAIDRGIASDSFVAENNETERHRYNYIAVFARRSDVWKLTHFISNMID